MIVLYNIVQLAFVLVFFPLIILFVACSSKYRDRIPARLGIGLATKRTVTTGAPKTIWLHALSVGEVTSAVPLVRGLREKYPTYRIVVSATTRSGKKVADAKLSSFADCIIDGPIDFLPVVRRFIKHIRPDLFILVETDFWPNLLSSLKYYGIPSILVNGRVSGRSMRRYQHLRFFFRPMFQCLAILCMQTLCDRKEMALLGVAPEKLLILGNLKFATRAQEKAPIPKPQIDLLPKNRILFIAGSTHPGEEQLLIDCYQRLRRTHPGLFLMLAPRDPNRAKEIADMATRHGLLAYFRSSQVFLPADIFILDTLGELVDFYALADLAFVGGSLVKKGGHNPVEPAAMAIPVLFGPHMEDFSEIAESLILAGGAIQVDDSGKMSEVLANLLKDRDQRFRMGQAAQKCVNGHRDIIDNHLHLIEKFL